LSKGHFLAHSSEIPSMVHTVPFAGMRDSVHGLLVPHFKARS